MLVHLVFVSQHFFCSIILIKQIELVPMFVKSANYRLGLHEDIQSAYNVPNHLIQLFHLSILYSRERRDSLSFLELLLMLNALLLLSISSMNE